MNPFVFGALALDDDFADRKDELSALVGDIASGQDVVIHAPRRYGKTSLALRAAQTASARGALVGYCDLMRTPTKTRFAAALAKTIHDDLASPLGEALMGAKIGDEVSFEAPGGTLTVTIVDIEG